MVTSSGDPSDVTDWHGRRQSIGAPCCGENSTRQLVHGVRQEEVWLLTTDLPLNDSTGRPEKQVRQVEPHQQRALDELKTVVIWTQQSKPRISEPRASLHPWQVHGMSLCGWPHGTNVEMLQHPLPRWPNSNTGDKVVMLRAECTKCPLLWNNQRTTIVQPTLNNVPLEKETTSVFSFFFF